ncbi:MAG: hypothetical protein JST14_18100 [Bacteroidetes bacterium]|nr:hypothetical protein [Bacteroidota bacterium]
MSVMFKKWLCLLFLLLGSLGAFLETNAQISVGIVGGVATSADKQDPFGLNMQWAPKGNPSDSHTQFFFGGKSTPFSMFVMWEVSPHFGIGLTYRVTNFSKGDMTTSHRNSSVNSMGIQFRINFVKNSKKVIPYMLAEYMFLNSFRVWQDQATSTTFPTQVQPAFSEVYSTNVGLGGSLGVEFKASQSLGLFIQGGYNGVMAEYSFPSALNYGNYVAPTGLSGIWFIQFSGGVRYYLGTGGKKRDF